VKDPYIEKPIDVVWWPTPQPAVDLMLQFAKPTSRDLLYDLGCGDGRIVVTAAKKYKTRSIGFDINKQRVFHARQNIRDNHVEDLASIRYGDIFDVDLSPASVITIYLLPKLNLRLLPQLKKCKPGTRVVSYDFDMDYMVPDASRHIDGHMVYFWILPFKRAAEKDKTVNYYTIPSAKIHNFIR
jgi:SAM-dependent methyltransferase